VGPCLKHSFSAGAALDERGSSPQTIKTVPVPVHGSSLETGDVFHANQAPPPPKADIHLQTDRV